MLNHVIEHRENHANVADNHKKKTQKKQQKKKKQKSQSTFPPFPF